MHFSIPDTEEVKDENGSIFITYNLNINGVFHCSVRYRQLRNLHQQLCREFSGSNLPSFPPKKLLSLTPLQIEERRISLEKYVLQLSQDPKVLKSDVFNGWLVWAQNESQRAGALDEVPIDIYTLNGNKVNFRVCPTLQTNDLLEKVCKHLNLASHLIYYFSLFLVKKDDNELIVCKKLQDFESPYLSQKCSETPLRIVLRKSYWETECDDVLAQDRVGLNLIYIQTVAEIERGWILSSKEILKQLATLQARGAKKEYLELARTLKYYGYMQFQQCFCDFPQSNTPVLIAAGNKELNFRIHCEDGRFKEGNFKVTRIRCWRISSLKDAADENHSFYNGAEGSSREQKAKGGNSTTLELSFEYLMNRDEMRWIKVISHQAVLISLCLQGMVQQLLGAKSGTLLKSPKDRIRKGSLSFMKKDGSVSRVILNHTGEPIEKESSATSPIGELSWKRLSERLSELSFLENYRPGSSSSDVNGHNDSRVVENNAFHVIGDESL